MLIHDFQPYSFVECRGFKELMEKLEPHQEIPHRTTFCKSVIPRMYKEVKEQVKSKVYSRSAAEEEQGSINNRYICEHQKQMRAYVRLSCHYYLTLEFELVSACLAVEHFSRWHTGVNIASGIRHMLNKNT